MPTYEYRCRDCSHRFDVVQAMKDETLTVCPACGGELRKVFAAPSISFKGSGFYATDHGKKSKTTSESTDEKSGEKTAASTESSDKKSETKDKKSEKKDKKESSKPAEKTVASASAASGSSDSGSTGSGSDGKERSS